MLSIMRRFCDFWLQNYFAVTILVNASKLRLILHFQCSDQLDQLDQVPLLKLVNLVKLVMPKFALFIFLHEILDTLETLRLIRVIRDQQIFRTLSSKMQR